MQVYSFVSELSQSNIPPSYRYPKDFSCQYAVVGDLPQANRGFVDFVFPAPMPEASYGPGIRHAFNLCGEPTLFSRLVLASQLFMYVGGETTVDKFAMLQTGLSLTFETLS